MERTSAAESRWVAWAVAGLFGVFALFVAFLWRLGMFDFTGTDASAKIVGSALALVGGLFGSLLTGVGIFLRLAFERRNVALQERNADRLQLESEHNARLAKVEQQRLRMETAIKAVGLMSTVSGADTSPAQKASAMILLANLGQLEFALVQLSARWPHEAIPPAAAVWLIDEGLQCHKNKARLQSLAAGILFHNYRNLFVGDDGSFEVPERWHLRWDTGITSYARRVGLELHLLLLLARSPWRTWPTRYLNHFFVMFHLIMTVEGSDRERGERRLQAGAALAARLLFEPVSGVGKGLFTPAGSRTFAELRAEIDAAIARLGGREKALGACTVRVIRLLEALGDWVEDDSAPGGAPSQLSRGEAAGPLGS